MSAEEFVKSQVQDNPALKIPALFGVQGRVALVTGGSRGIGLMAAKALVTNGAVVYISARKAEVCEKVAAELTALGPGTCHALPADLATDAECKRLAAELAKKEKCLHILINNAGATWGAPMDEHPESAWGKIMTLNVASIFHLTRACRSLLQAGSAGNLDPSHVINIGSVGGEMASPLDNNPAYLASKAAVAHLSRSLAAQFCREGIVVNTIEPAVFPSKMTYDFQLASQEGADMARRAHPVGRVGAEEDMAGMVLFLSSKASAFVTGATLTLDGGMVAIRGADRLPLPEARM